MSRSSVPISVRTVLVASGPGRFLTDSYKTDCENYAVISRSNDKITLSEDVLYGSSKDLDLVQQQD
jgi:hypothetical protein